MIHLRLALMGMHGRQDLNDPPTFRRRDSRRNTVLLFIGWTLTNHRLPPVGFDRSEGQKYVYSCL
jgi:hypothetical protein